MSDINKLLIVIDVQKGFFRKINDLNFLNNIIELMKYWISKKRPIIIVSIIKVDKTNSNVTIEDEEIHPLLKQFIDVHPYKYEYWMKTEHCSYKK